MTPARALGRDLLSRGYRVEVITDKRGLNYQSMFDGMPMHEVKAGTLKSGLIGKISGVTNVGLGVAQALMLIKKLKPAVVVGFGGYPSFPGVFAAQKLKIPTMLIIHVKNYLVCLTY